MLLLLQSNLDSLKIKKKIFNDNILLILYFIDACLEKNYKAMDLRLLLLL